VRVVELIEFPSPARRYQLISCHVVCFDLNQQRVVRDVTVKP
jgi:hypothetical protein